MVLNILVVNAGSSSLKYQLVNIANNKVLAKGLCERVGSEQSLHKHGIDENEFVYNCPCQTIPLLCVWFWTS